MNQLAKLESTVSMLSNQLNKMRQAFQGKARPSVIRAHHNAVNRVHVGSSRRLTDPEKDQIAALFLKGFSAIDLRPMFRVSRQSIYNALRARGIDVHALN